MLYKTILEIEKGLNEDDKVVEIATNISRALEEIQNYKIAYILSVENASLQDKKKELQGILNAFDEIKDFVKKENVS